MSLMCLTEETHLQLGIVVHGAKIESVTPGSPAHDSQDLCQVDDIVASAVNGVIASRDNIQKQLGTEDFLGTPVVATIATEVSGIFQ